MPNTTLGIIPAYSLEQSRYFSSLLKAFGASKEHAEHRKPGSLGAAGRGRKRAIRVINPSLADEVATAPWRKLALFSSSWLPPAERYHTAHPIPQHAAHYKIALETGKYRS